MRSFFVLVILSSCSSLKESSSSPSSNNLNSISNSTSINNSSDLKKAIAKRIRDKRIADLEKSGYRDPAATAELNILKAGGTMREAELANKLYARGLSDDEMSEKRKLEQERLSIKQENPGQNEGSAALAPSDSNSPLVAPPRH